MQGPSQMADGPLSVDPDRLKKAHGNTLDGISGTEVSNTCFRAALYATNYRHFFSYYICIALPPKNE